MRPPVILAALAVSLCIPANDCICICLTPHPVDRGKGTEFHRSFHQYFMHPAVHDHCHFYQVDTGNMPSFFTTSRQLSLFIVKTSRE
jgi:hypothetical protein